MCIERHAELVAKAERVLQEKREQDVERVREACLPANFPKGPKGDSVIDLPICWV